jgi:hypothetical protein
VNARVMGLTIPQPTKQGETKTGYVQDGKPSEIQVVCELTFRKNNTLILSLIDVARPDKQRKPIGYTPFFEKE